MDDHDKPARAVAAAEDQATPADPEVLLMLADTIAEYPDAPLDSDDLIGPALGAACQMLACMRRVHLQRSGLLRLTSVTLFGFCFRGKNKGGF